MESVSLPPRVGAALGLPSPVACGGGETEPVGNLLFKRTASVPSLCLAALNCSQEVHGTLTREKPWCGAQAPDVRPEKRLRQPAQSPLEGNAV